MTHGNGLRGIKVCVSQSWKLEQVGEMRPIHELGAKGHGGEVTRVVYMLMDAFAKQKVDANGLYCEKVRVR